MLPSLGRLVFDSSVQCPLSDETVKMSHFAQIRVHVAAFWTLVGSLSIELCGQKVRLIGKDCRKVIFRQHSVNSAVQKMRACIFCVIFRAVFEASKADRAILSFLLSIITIPSRVRWCYTAHITIKPLTKKKNGPGNNDYTWLITSWPVLNHFV